MPDRQDHLHEDEFGIRAARRSFATLINKVDQGRCIVHLTRTGKRVAALVGQDAVEQLKHSTSEVLAWPGDTASAIKLFESLRVDADDEWFTQGVEALSIDELAGGTVLLLDALLTCPRLNNGELIMVDEDGEKTGETKLVAELIMAKLHNQEYIDPSVLPIIAAGLWAMQARENPTRVAQQDQTAIDFRGGSRLGRRFS